MTENQNENTPKLGPKSFLSVGPTLHYSHNNVISCWVVSLGVFVLACLFWSKLLAGVFFSFDPDILTDLSLWRIGHYTVDPVSIFEYPWQILVLGLLMGILSVVPILTSQLMSFRHSLLFVLAIFFVANMPGFALVVLFSAWITASRPLRFRSRFIAIALCISPQLIFWGLAGGVRDAEPLKWGFSFAPWLCAWLCALFIAGFVLGIGHFTRYRPGLIWSSSAAVFITAIIIFGSKVGFDELDYQLYVAGNNPKEAVEFHDHSIKEALDETIMNEQVLRYLAGFFYSTDDRIALRIRLKEEIRSQLRIRDRWPNWFRNALSDELIYWDKRDSLNSQYEKFIWNRPNSERMPRALYYQAMLSELIPDYEMIVTDEVLHFYSDYPREETRKLWYDLYVDFPESLESIEARWRIAKHWSGEGMFEQALTILDEAQGMIDKYLEELRQQPPVEETFLGLFNPPGKSALTAYDLRQDLTNRLDELKDLIGQHNYDNINKSKQRLAIFVMLNPHTAGYQLQLDELLNETKDKDPLRDNIQLEQICLIADMQLRAEELSKLHKEYKDRDGGVQAYYDLALLKIGLWRQQDQADTARRESLLTQARDSLSDFIKLYPDNFRTDNAREILSNLPKVN